MLSRASSFTDRSPAARAVHRSARHLAVRPAHVTTAARCSVTEGQRSRGHGERGWEGAGWDKKSTVASEFRDMLVRYGELAQATYDNLETDSSKEAYGFMRPPTSDLLAYLSKDYSFCPLVSAEPSRQGTGEVYSLPAPTNFEGGELSPIIYAQPGKNVTKPSAPETTPSPDPDSWSESWMQRHFGSGVDGIWDALSTVMVAFSQKADPRPLFKCEGDSLVPRGTFIGYVAVSQPQGAAGEVDVALVWRGTLFKEEWESNFAQNELSAWESSPKENLGDNVPPSPDRVGVHDGFDDIYERKIKQGPSAHGLFLSPREVVREWLKVLMRDHNVTTITTTGHSLGGAMATLCAYDVGELLQNEWEKWEKEHWKTQAKPKATVVSFAAPRVGNYTFGEEFRKLNIRALRVVNKEDWVPKVPGNIISNVLEGGADTDKDESLVKALKRYYAVTLHLAPFFPSRLGYFHVGQVLLLDSTDSNQAGEEVAKANLENTSILKKITQSHNLELYLYLVSKLVPDKPGRNLLLLNKSEDLIKWLPAKWWDAPGRRGCELRNGRWYHPELERK